MADHVRLGFAVGSGDEVRIPIRHMCVTGQTQEAGKTTTLEALIVRSQLRALTFITKRGEGAFAGADAQLVAPYFREQADWRFVSSLLEAFLGERLKFERSWIMRASKGARTLADVRHNVTRLMAKATGLNADVFMVLGEYLDELVPAIAAVTWAPRVALGRGVNVMDLTAIPGSLQHLVIKSSIDWVLEHEEATVVVVPEAWKFIPQGRGTPVKLSAQAYIRQGAGLRNYLWLDSQDIGGVDKEILRSVPVWVLGVQREANEIKRTLTNIPASIAKPKAADIATLELGEFIACWGRHAITVYVQPAGMSEDTARGIAKGLVTRTVWRSSTVRASGAAITVHADEQSYVGARQRLAIQPAEEMRLRNVQPGRLDHAGLIAEQVRAFVAHGQAAQRAVDQVIAQHITTQKGGIDEMNPQQEKKLDSLVAAVDKLASAIAGRPPQANVSNGPAPTTGPKAAPSGDIEALYQFVKRRLIEELPTDPRVMEIVVERPELRVKVQRAVLTIDGDSLSGRLARLLAEGYFDEAKSGNAARVEMTKRGWTHDPRSVYRACDDLTAKGFLRKESDGYHVVEAMKRHVVEE